jgi:restriction system protein
MGCRRSNVLEDIFDIGVLLPWWVTLVLAVGAYLLFHSLSAMYVAPVTGTENLGKGVPQLLLKNVSVYLQYAVPALLVLGVVTSLTRSWHRSLLFNRISRSESADSVDALSWEQFETLIHEWFYRRGYVVSETSKGPDGGIDLKVRKDGKTASVQCKHWKSRKVGVNIVREQFGIMAAENLDEGFVVSSGEFTADAYSFAKSKPLRLVNGQQLQSDIQRGSTNDLLTPAFGQSEPQSCPKCSSRMVLRTARKGPTAGTQFWGCISFPKCRGTRQAS